MKLHSLPIFAGLALLLTACDSKENKEPVIPETDFSDVAVRIEPIITKVTETDFVSGDAIGLTITREAGVHASNEKLTYDGTAFTGSLKWYAEGADKSTLAAYYPYADAVPTSFTVAADQSTEAALSASDFVSAVKADVLPSANAISMAFKHQLSRIVITVVNNSGSAIEGITLKGAVPTAAIAADLTATAAEGVAPVDIKTGLSGEKYYAILPPQTVSLKAAVSYAGLEREQNLAEADLVAGKQYSISIIVNAADIKVVLSGDIENWNDGGEIGEEPVASDTEEHLSDGYILYAGERYNVVKMKDNKWWMAQNLRFVPEGITPASDLSAVTAGVFCPLKVNDGHTAAEFATDAETIAAKGYLYQSETALGLQVGDLAAVADAEALEGARGICPTGWHVPTIDDITGLVGKAVSPIATNADAPYYDGSNGSIAMLNADGFAIDADGAISIADNTKAAGTFMGWLKAYPDKISSSMMIGSSYAGVTYNTNGDATSGIKNVQFYGLMPMTNKATEAEYTCNGTKVSYRIAGPVRCVRDAE